MHDQHLGIVSRTPGESLDLCILHYAFPFSPFAFATLQPVSPIIVAKPPVSLCSSLPQSAVRSHAELRPGYAPTDF